MLEVDFKCIKSYQYCGVRLACNKESSYPIVWQEIVDLFLYECETFSDMLEDLIKRVVCSNLCYGSSAIVIVTPGCPALS